MGRHALWRVLRLALLFGGGLAVLTAGFVGLEQVALNHLLPRLLNRHPERLRIDYDEARMIVPGEVELRGLRIRGQTPGQQWRVTADAVTATLSLGELGQQRVHARAVTARGITFRLRAREDRPNPDPEPAPPAAPPVADAAPHQPDADARPPIPGLHNPPDPRPEDLYPPPPPWEVRLDDIEATDLRELWINGLRLRGLGRAEVTLIGQRPYFDLDARLHIDEMVATHGEATLAEALHGEVSLTLAGFDRTAADDERLASLSGEAQLGLEVGDLRALDPLLELLPWLRLGGTGHAELQIGFDGAQLRPGSRVRVTLPSLRLRVLENEITGAGRLDATVGPDATGALERRLVLGVDDFAITTNADGVRIVEGTGLRMEATSPDAPLTEPPTQVEVRLTLPRSHIPDIAAFNAFLPSGVDLTLTGGSSTVHGELWASSEDAAAHGDLFIDGEDIDLHFGRYDLVADMAVRAHLTGAQLTEGLYVLTGSELVLTEGGVGAHQTGSRRPSRRWSATLSVLQGKIKVGASPFLDTTLRVRASDSAPFVLIIASRRALPRWVRDRMTVSGVSGEARVQVGDGWITVQPCRVRGGDHRVDLRYRKRGASASGALLFRSGHLSVGVALLPGGPQLQLFNAQRWFFGIHD